MKKLRLLLPFAFAATVWAQTTSFPLSLKQFLDLTDAQVLQIGKFSDNYNQTVREKQVRISQLQIEINQQTANDPIDPMELGVRYAEIAQIQKDLRNELENLRRSVRQVLTDAQRAKVKTLEDARTLQPLISEALCAGFIDPSPIQWFDITGFIGLLPTPVTAVRTGDFSQVPGFAFGCGASGISGSFLPGPGPVRTIFPLALKQFVGLTDDQVIAIGRFSDSYNQDVRDKQVRISQLQIEIGQETAKDPIDPMELGVRYAEIAQIQKDLRSGLMSMQAGVRQVLTDPQRAKVKMLDDAMKLQPLISEATCAGFIEPVPNPFFGAFGISPGNTVSITGGISGSIPGVVFGCPAGIG